MSEEKKQTEEKGRTFTRDDVAKMINAERDKWETAQKEKENKGKRRSGQKSL